MSASACSAELVVADSACGCVGDVVSTPMSEKVLVVAASVCGVGGVGDAVSTVLPLFVVSAVSAMF